jgi:ABC-type sulfate transport system permease component
MYNLIPETYSWKGSVFRFLGMDLSSIISLLASSGILNSTNPSVMFSIAVRVFKYPFGMHVVWVAIGVIEDMA